MTIVNLRWLNLILMSYGLFIKVQWVYKFKLSCKTITSFNAEILNDS